MRQTPPAAYTRSKALWTKLAYALGVDALELRLKNCVEQD
jgi:CO/xanthine dehydrogenase Mo-binding subunit